VYTRDMIFTNGPSDTIRAAFERYTQTPCGVLLACPFFSSSDLVRELIRRECSVRLVVRLSAATDPDALRVISKLNVPVRYFTNRRFHSKIYIFGDDVALVGSANLTDSGIQSNREVCVGIDREDPRYERLVQLFQAYWDEASPLSEETLRSFASIIAENRMAIEDVIASKIRSAFGDVAPSGGVQVGGHRKSKEQVYLSDYKRVYQEFLQAFRILEGIYRSFKRRQQPDEIVPFRLEMDSFFSFIRETFAQGDAYQTAPLRHGPELEQNVRHHLEQWFKQRWPYLDDVMPVNYARIKMVLATPEKISAASYDELFDALTVCHAFYETLRFHKGAMPALRHDFMRDNSLDRVKRTLIYLLFGSGDFVERMGNCIFNGEYFLAWFGRSCVQETFGWVNGEDIPICNGRTVKSMRYLGFNVRTF
jgi:hypothetical protein